MKKPLRLPHLLPAMLAVFTVTGVTATELQINELQRTTTNSLEQARIDEQALDNRERVRFLAGRIENELRRVRSESSVSDSARTLVEDLQAPALRQGLQIVSLKPLSSVLDTNGTLGDARRADFELCVRGTYRNLIAFTDTISHIPTLTRVIDTRLERSNAEHSGKLEETLHLQTIRFDLHTVRRHSTPLAHLPVPSVIVHQDPFARGLAAAPQPSATPSETFAAEMAAAFGAAPSSSPAPATATPIKTEHLLGTVLGAHPYAIVDDAGTTRFVTINDTWQGRRIVAITSSGLSFDDRSSLRVPLMDQ